MSGDRHPASGSYLESDDSRRSWLSSLDHKRIAIVYLAAIAAVCLLGVTLAMVLGGVSLGGVAGFLDEDSFRRVMSMHGLLMLLFCVLPAIPAVLGNFALPLMFGAPNLAYPRLNLWSLRLYLLGLFAMLGAVLAGATGQGWELNPPYAAGDRVALIMLALGLHAIGLHLVFMAINFLATLVGRRPDGMGWEQMPLFAWSLLSASLVWLVTAPVLASLGLMLLADMLTSSGLFDVLQGGDPSAWRRYFWFFAHPAFAAALLPAFGVAAEILATFSRRRPHSYRGSVLALMALGVLSLLGWGSHFVLGGENTAYSVVFSALSLLAIVPALVLLFNLLATLIRGAIEPRVPLLYVCFFILLAGVGGVGSVFLGALGSAEQLVGTAFEGAVMHYLLLGAVLCAWLGGLHYWWPKIFGRLYSEKPAAFAAWLIFIGVNLSFGVRFILGGAGLAGDAFETPPELIPWQRLGALGMLILCLGLLLFVLNLIRSLLSGKVAPANPWGGTTLEWSIDSPPAHENFDGIQRPGGAYDFSEQTYDVSEAAYGGGRND